MTSKPTDNIIRTERCDDSIPFVFLFGRHLWPEWHPSCIMTQIDSSVALYKNAVELGEMNCLFLLFPFLTVLASPGTFILS